METNMINQRTAQFRNCISAVKFFLLATLLHFSIAATAAPDNLDPSFGTNGKVITPLEATHEADVLSVQLQSDGKILVLTIYEYPDSGIVLPGEFIGNKIARFLPNGAIDSTFGDNGVVSLPSYSRSFNFGYMTISDMAIKKNGKIVLLGTANEPDVGGDEGPLVMQLTNEGEIDKTFGSGNGYVSYYSSNYNYLDGVGQIGLQQDERILASISGWASIESPEHGSTSAPNLTVMRFRSDGSIDASFAQGVGVAEIPSDAHILGDAMTIDRASGNIVVGGNEGEYELFEGGYTSSGILKIARLTKSGVVDETFGNNGAINIGTEGHGYISNLFVTPTQKLLVAGRSGVENIFARFNSNGSLHKQFRLPWTMGYEQVQLQAGGKILISGRTNGNFIISRLNWSGELDNSFGGGDGYISHASEFALQPDGKIVAISWSEDNKIVLARYLNDPTDLTPNAIRFANRASVARGAEVTSNPIVIRGLTNATHVPVNITGGSYSINNKAYTTNPGWVKNGDVVRVKHKANSRRNATTKSTLIVGGLQSRNNIALVLGQRVSATFSSKTGR